MLSSSQTSTKNAFVLIGDSNAEGWFSTGIGPDNYFNLLSSAILNMQTQYTSIGFTNFRDPARYGITISGVTNIALTGPTNSALQMTAGSSIEFTSSAEFVEFWYNGDTSGGIIQIAYNGNIYRTVNCNSTNQLNVSSFARSATPTGKIGLYSLRCQGGDVTVTALFTGLPSAVIQNKPVYFLRDAASGQAIASFNVSNIALTTGLTENVNTFYLLALGTNDIYNPYDATTAKQYGINLAKYLKVLTNKYLTVGYFMPPQPPADADLPVFESYDNYHTVAETVCRQYNVRFFDPGTELSMKSNESYWSVNLHYSQQGHAALASYFLEHLNLTQFAQ